MYAEIKQIILRFNSNGHWSSKYISLLSEFHKWHYYEQLILQLKCLSRNFKCP